MCLSHTSFVPLAQTKIPPHREPFCKARRHSTLLLTTNATDRSVSPRAQDLTQHPAQPLAVPLLHLRRRPRRGSSLYFAAAHQPVFPDPRSEKRSRPRTHRSSMRKPHLRISAGRGGTAVPPKQVHSSSGNEICRSAILSFETNCLHPKSHYIVDLTSMPRIGRHCLSGARPQMCRRLQTTR